jgi:hypothetical protein
MIQLFNLTMERENLSPTVTFQIRSSVRGNDLLFLGQSPQFFAFSMQLAKAADNARRELER